ncbi:MAG: hypothetical protein V4858_22500 [Pseudomonadota bacterium]
MRRFYFRVGPWLFVAAVAWYLAGNFLIGSLEAKSQARALSLHKTSQDFEIGTQGVVEVHTEGEELNMQTVKIDFQPGASLATVQNENLRVSVRGQLVDGVLHLTVGGSDRRHYASRKEVSLVLPPSVKRLRFPDAGRFEVTGRVPNPAADLNLEILNCHSEVNVKHLSVHQLTLTSSCQMHVEAQAEKRCCNMRFDLDRDVVVSKLDVSMESGSFEFRGNAIPQTQLHVGELVEVTGRRAFLQAARFAKPLR